MAKQGTDIEEAVAAWCADRTPENLETVMLKSQGYVQGIISRVQNTVPRLLNKDDLIQCGLLGLLSALKRYDPARRVPFRTWCYPRVRGAAQDAIRRMSPTSRTRNLPMVSYDEIDYSVPATNNNLPGIFHELIPDEVSKALAKALESLPIRQHAIILFLLNGLKTKHLANILDISMSRIQQERQAAIAKLASQLTLDINGTISGILPSRSDVL